MRKTTIITFLCLVVLTVKAQLLTDWQNLYIMTSCRASPMTRTICM